MSRMMMMGKGSRRAGASGYTAQGVAFNNSPYLTGTANTDFTGAVDGDTALVSFWFKPLELLG
jgi:hypothetical protein